MHQAKCILLALLWICGAGFVPLEAREHSEDAFQPVWVMSNGFHSAIALRTSDAGPLVRSAMRDRHARWVIVGWGDRDYFTKKKANPWITLKAVGWPTESALHIIPLRNPPEVVYRRTDIIRLKLSPESVTRLRAYLERQFAIDGAGRPVSLGRGFSETSGFFLGSEKFYFPKMCNWWVADGLREAGVPLSRSRSITAHELMRQLKKYGKKTGARRLPVDGF